MKTKKMSLANIQGKLSRAEMKKIMAGSGSGPNGCSEAGQDCLFGYCCQGLYCDTNQYWGGGGGDCVPCAQNPDACS